MDSQMKHARGLKFLALATLALLMALLIASASTAFAQEGKNPNPDVIPPNAHPHGKSYGEWSAQWWQWVFSIPASTNPLLDPDGRYCREGQSGKVWFLAGSWVGSVERHCTIPTGTALFFPVLNAAYGASVFDCEPTVPGVACDVETLRRAAAAPMNAATDLNATIDGVPVRNLMAYRIQSPVFPITAPPDGLIPSGTAGPNVSDGYWLFLNPLPPGDHTISFGGEVPGWFSTEVTYHITVQPGR